jgi:hypothetical protein
MKVRTFQTIVPELGAEALAPGEHELPKDVADEVIGRGLGEAMEPEPPKRGKGKSEE